MFLNILLIFLTASVSLCFGFNKYQFISDLNEISNIGSQYFNKNGSCSVPSNISLIPVVQITSVDDLLDLSSFRLRYLSNSLVIFNLNLTDSGSTPAYRLTGSYGLKLFYNVSCSYITGQGYTKTSIILDYPHSELPYSYKYNPIEIDGAFDVFIVDVTVDRANSSFRDYAYDCLAAGMYVIMYVM